MSYVNLTPGEAQWKMPGKSERVQSTSLLEKIVGIMDALRMFCVVLKPPRGKSFFCVSWRKGRHK